MQPILLARRARASHIFECVFLKFFFSRKIRVQVRNTRVKRRRTTASLHLITLCVCNVTMHSHQPTLLFALNLLHAAYYTVLRAVPPYYYVYLRTYRTVCVSFRWVWWEISRRNRWRCVLRSWSSLGSVRYSFWCGLAFSVFMSSKRNPAIGNSPRHVLLSSALGINRIHTHNDAHCAKLFCRRRILCSTELVLTLSSGEHRAWPTTMYDYGRYSGWQINTLSLITLRKYSIT